MQSLQHLYKKIEAGARISAEEAVKVLGEGDFFELGRLAQHAMRRYHPGETVTFLIDRNINYTNICISRCRFCAFYRDVDAPDAYLLSPEEILEKVSEAVQMGATQIMLQGGLHPNLPLEYFEDVLRKIKARFAVSLHSFSPPEIHHFAHCSGLSITNVLLRLRDAGLDSLPGGGAEILSERVRHKISPAKITAKRWLEIMESAHRLGIKTTATMMIGSVETLRERIQHLRAVRDLQDRTGGFRAFIPWTFTARNTELGGPEISSVDYLRTLAVSRIYLDNIKNIQGSWVTQGKEVGQMSLFFGANDLGSIMLEENVVRAAGGANKITEFEMVELIRRAGKTPLQRNTQYEIVKHYD